MSNMQQLQWSVFDFPELGPQLFHDILKLRIDVFVVEQNCPYPELDGSDIDALHIVGRKADGTVVAYARILPPQADGLPHIGRVVVVMEYRQKGVGKRLMEVTLEAVVQRYGRRRSVLAAQAHLRQFYAELGYVTNGEEYLLDGIPHVEMLRDSW